MHGFLLVMEPVDIEVVDVLYELVIRIAEVMGENSISSRVRKLSIRIYCQLRRFTYV